MSSIITVSVWEPGILFANLDARFPFSFLFVLRYSNSVTSPYSSNHLSGIYTTAQSQCPLLKHKRVSPHVLRHTAAMELLHAGVDTSVIALWLGHESVETTQVYIETHLALKEAALGKKEPLKGNARGRYRPPDQILAFLNNL